MRNETPQRRWYQFSLRTLMIVMLVSCLGFAWIGVRLQRARENRARVAAVKLAVVAIEKMGGVVWSEYEDLRPQTWLERQFDDPGGRHDPVGVLNVTEVLLWDTDAIDADLEHVQELTTLIHLAVGDRADSSFSASFGPEYSTMYEFGDHKNRKAVTDVGLKHLQRLTNLRILDLNGTRITDAGLVHLKGLTKLEILDVSDTNVADAGLKHITRLKSLEVLYLFDTHVTDAGLEHLRGLTNLKYLVVSVKSNVVTDEGLMVVTEDGLMKPKITFEGIKKLQQALPICKILR